MPRSERHHGHPKKTRTGGLAPYGVGRSDVPIPGGQDGITKWRCPVKTLVGLVRLKLNDIARFDLAEATSTLALVLVRVYQSLKPSEIGLEGWSGCLVSEVCAEVGHHISGL